MLNTQNEIKYQIAVGILYKLFAENHIDRDEYDVAHTVIIERFAPCAVRRLP